MNDTSFRMLGPLAVPGEIVSGRAAALLTRLLLTPGRVVSIEALIDDLWGEDPPESARLSLRVVMSRLRKTLAMAGAGDVIATCHPGYRADVDPACVDAIAFERIAQDARALATAGDAGSAAVAYELALGLWRGEALAGIDAPFAAAHVARLDELRLQAIEGRLKAQLACGAAAELIPDVEALCTEHPLREGLWATRIIALYRANRQADALRAYQQLRTVLVEELGIEPSPEIARLEAAILAQHPSLSAPDAPDLPAHPSRPDDRRPILSTPAQRADHRVRRARCRVGRAV